MSSKARTVVITGIGALTPLGIGAPLTFDKMLEGETGFKMIDRWDTSEFGTHFAAEVRGCIYKPEDHFTTLQLRRMDPFSQVGLVAAKEAWADSGLDVNAIDSTRAGAILGTGIGGIQSILEQSKILAENGPRRVTPYFISNTMANALAANVAIEFGLQGACFLTSSACASSGHAIGMALHEIRSGRADIMVTGGSETTTNELCLAGFNSVKALSKRNDDIHRASRPFDRDRDGFVMGEGAGVLVIESLEHAQARGAKIYCELAGFGQSDDAGHITAPDSTGNRPAAALQLAMKDAGIDPSEVDYINAHGTSTMLNDMVETKAIKIALGEENAKNTAISSTKSMIGHLVGAAAGVEAIVTALSLHRGIAPQTQNYETPDLENGLDLDYIPNEPRKKAFRAALSNSLGFGGHNVSIAFRRFDQA
ncbi:MAG: beta-ketoacyl-ACP synthase II [Planctomycetota bacterium]|nr:beta-ketoacyl-ACP synthase II [Planctomycetota bacterium]MDA1114146.1 beta-ketoacyl-ACP synthase II [Planctomycetota bacterium]